MLNIDRLTYRIAGRTILDDVSASIPEGWKVGVIGANGAGKSTLFKLIAGELQADGGTVDLNDRYSMGMVRQDMPESDEALLDIVLAADTERAKLMAASETEEDPYKLGDIYEKLTAMDAYAAPARAATVLSGLGFKEAQLSEPFSSFSGGWRMRVALAAALFREPDFLLLDEPTNHLDLEAIMWLETYLANYPKTVMIISHDRDLLNTCVDHILHVDGKKLTTYTGTYDTFERERAAALHNQQKLHEKQMAQKAHMQAFIDRFKAKASKAKQAQSRMKALEKMDVVEAVMAERAVKFHFPPAEELPAPLITFDKVDVGYKANEPVLRGLNDRLDPDDRIALLGANGNGKSTLMKLIAGRLQPMAGHMQTSNKLRIGYFAQHQADELDMQATPYSEMTRKMPGRKEADVRAKLGRFGFSKPLSDNTIASLSGGEKARLLFALMSCENPHLLLLDEPTNHLDMDAREALVQALNAFEGAVVLVSHDPSMVERVADRLWLVSDGGCDVFEGDLDAYRRHIIEQRRKEKRAEKKSGGNKNKESDGGKKTDSKKDLKKALAEKKKRLPDLWGRVARHEEELARLVTLRKTMEKAMAQPDFYADEETARTTQQNYGRLLHDIDEEETALLEAMEAFEAAA